MIGQTILYSLGSVLLLALFILGVIVAIANWKEHKLFILVFILIFAIMGVGSALMFAGI